MFISVTVSLVITKSNLKLFKSDKSVFNPRKCLERRCNAAITDCLDAHPFGSFNQIFIYG